MKRLSLRAFLYWLAPTSSVGTLSAQVRTAPDPGPVAVDTIAGLTSRFLSQVPTVRVFLPPGYAGSRTRFPVLYANDGQDMEALGLAGTMDSLSRSGAISPAIVVAIHAGESRLQNYGTAGQPNAQGLGAAAEAYENFVVRELVPLVERRYRVTREPAVIMGWSLGGLSAVDLAWRNDDKFAAVGAFSGSFWWRTNDSTVESKQASRIMHRRIRDSDRIPRLRVWLEAGRSDERDDRDGNGVIDAIQDTRELIDELGRKGLREGSQVQYLEVDGGHNPETWGKALPAFLTWAFPPTP